MTGTCTHCGETGPIVVKEKGWIASCYYRWYRAGKPAGGPPPRQRDRKRRTEEYLHLRSNDVPPADACRQIGLLSDSSRRRYENARKAVA